MNSALGPLTGRGLEQIPQAKADNLPPSAESKGNFAPIAALHRQLLPHKRPNHWALVGGMQ